MILSDPSKQKSLKSNFIWMVIGRAIFSLCQWLIIVVLTKMTSVDAVGRYAFVLAVTAPVIMATNLSISSVLVTDAKSTFIFGNYVALRLFTTAIAFLIFLVMTVILSPSIEVAALFLVVGATRAFDAFSDLLYGLFRKIEQMNLVGISSILTGILSIVLMVLFLLATKSIVWGVSGICLASLITLLFYNAPNSIRLGPLIKPVNLCLTERLVGAEPFWDIHKIKKLILISFPLGLIAIIFSLNANIPRYFIEGYCGEKQLGYFAALMYPVIAGSMFMNTLGETVMPRMAKYYSSGETRLFKIMILKLTGIGVAIGFAGLAIVAIAGKQFLSIIYKPEYADQIDLFILLAVGMAIWCMYVFIGTAITAMGKFKQLLVMKIAATIILLVLSVVMTKYYGVIGAAWAIIIANALECIIYIVFGLKTIWMVVDNSVRDRELLPS